MRSAKGTQYTSTVNAKIQIAFQYCVSSMKLNTFQGVCSADSVSLRAVTVSVMGVNVCPLTTRNAEIADP